jgi:uncharacterized protein (TIGR00297 family)
LNSILQIYHSPFFDWIYTFIAFIAISLIISCLEYIHKKYHIAGNITRKLLHVIVGLLVCLSVLIIHTSFPIIIIAFIFILVNWLAIRKQKLRSIHINSYSYGTVYYPIATIILVLLLWQDHKFIFILSILIMSISDTFAGIIGDRFARNYFILVKEKKSIIGTITMFFYTFFILIIGFLAYYEQNIGNSILLSVIIALPVTVSETVSSKGNDNLFVPLMAAVFIYGMTIDTAGNLKYQLIFGEFLSFIVCFLSFYFKFLHISGVFIVFLLGTIIFGFGGIPFALPILAFFILSSLLSRVGKKRKKLIESVFEKTGTRDYAQVLANGLLPALIVLTIFYSRDNSLYLIYLTAIAVAMADTWATELGIFSEHRPRLITSFKQVEHGTSGAVSLLGTLASILGSLIIALTGIILINNFEIHIEYVAYFSIITLSGLSGSLIDSLIGATIQGQYQCKICMKTTEKKVHCGSESVLIKGKAFFNNDLVNIVSITITTIITYTILKIIIQ